MSDKPIPLAGTPTAPVVLVAAPSAADLLVDAWFVETFHNLALPTDLQNRLGEARDTLKARLRAKEL